MSTSNMVGVNTGELGRLGNELRGSGGIVKSQVKKVSDNLFGPGEAGENYGSQGKDIQSGLERLRQRLDDWSTATVATADAVGAATVSYTTVDEERASQTAKI